MSERRITSDTGGSKNQKTARFDLIPSPFLWQLAEVYGYGCQKYDDENWRLGYGWKLTWGAMQRHLHAFWMGEDYDEESGLHHLAHAAWHMATLFTFSTEESEKYGRFDDRPMPEMQEVGRVDEGPEGLLRSGAVSHKIRCPCEDESIIPTRYELTD